MEDLVERTEAPTQRRRDEARREGRVPRSADLTAAAMLLGGALLLSPIAMHLLGRSQRLIEAALTGSTGEPRQQLAQSAATAVWMLAPVALLVPLIGLLVGAIQTGFLFTLRPLAPQLSRLSPAQAARQLFSSRGAARFGMSMGKVSIVLAVAAIAVAIELPRVLGLVELEAAPLLTGSARIIWKLAVEIATVLLLLGLLDFVLQRRRHDRELHMTRHEAREEQRRSEGDPLMRQRRRRIARELAMQRMHGQMSRADVMIVHPGRFAAALRYDKGIEAPKLIAKACGESTAQLDRIAAAHGVTIVERPQIAQALCRRLEVGQQVPPNLYQQVAEILAQVYGRECA